MPQLELVDAFSDHLTLWDRVQGWPLARQIEAWNTHYSSAWPELWQQQVNCYAEEGEDWRIFAGEYVFPFLTQRLPAMRIAHRNLLELIANVYQRGQQTLNFDSDLACVIYVGIGCGAGWATSYRQKPAILFGLENIAEEGWQGREALTGLMAHELGHLAHFLWRERAGIARERGPWWQLYTEGFAQCSEHLLQGKFSWHMQSHVGEEWQTWCRENRAWLASEYLRRIEEGEDLRPFFGSWYDLRGYKQTGYFLGHELIRILQEKAGLQQIALLQNVGDHLRPLLIDMAG